jgi:prepilin-type N-terminal cleavage/methylation domain-containing protein
VNSSFAAHGKQAFTLIELLVVLAIATILLFMLAPVTERSRPAKRPVCMSNLRQISIGFMIYAEDHRDAFPWQTSPTNSESQMLNLGLTAADYFASLTNYQRQPKIYLCPTDERGIVAPTNFHGFSDSNLSYFVSLNASINLVSTNITNLLLSGDRHLSWNTSQAKPGLLLVTNFSAMSWTKELHWVKNQKETVGVLAFVDGHVESVQAGKLPAAFQRQGIKTNQLVIP